MKIDLPEDVAQELQEITRKHGIELDFLLRLMISRYKEAERGRDKPYPTLADLVENAEAAGLASAQPVDTAARSREILQTEYADYLKSRIDP